MPYSLSYCQGRKINHRNALKLTDCSDIYFRGCSVKACQNAGSYFSVILSEDITLNIGIPKHSVLRTRTSILSPEWPLPYQYFRGFLKSCFIEECIFYLLISTFRGFLNLCSLVSKLISRLLYKFIRTSHVVLLSSSREVLLECHERCLSRPYSMGPVFREKSVVTLLLMNSSAFMEGHSWLLCTPGSDSLTCL
jgi:hypothetical protein